MIVYTSIFTPKDKEISSNKYISLLPIWLAFILRNGNLRREDKVYVLIDTESFTYIMEQNQTLRDHIKTYRNLLNLKFLGFDRPATIVDGMVKRYTIIEDAFCVHLDVDCLVKKSLRELFPNVVETDEGVYIEKDGSKIGNFMFVSPEGNLLHSDYGGSVIDEGTDKAKNLHGFTPSIFAYSPCSQVDEFFQQVVKQTLEKETPLYTIDQPFFNKEVAERILQRKPCDIFFQKVAGSISFNNISDSKCHILNLAGAPGDGDFHFDKAVFALSLLYCKSTDLTKTEQQEPKKPKDILHI